MPSGEQPLPQVLPRPGETGVPADPLRASAVYDGPVPDVEGPPRLTRCICPRTAGRSIRWIDASTRSVGGREAQECRKRRTSCKWITSQAIEFIRDREAGGPTATAPIMASPPCTPPEGWRHYDPADVPVPELRADDLALKPGWYRECYEAICQRPQPDIHAALHREPLRPDALHRPPVRRIMDTLEDPASRTRRAVHGRSRGSLNDHGGRHGPFLRRGDEHPDDLAAAGRASGAVTEEMIEQVDVMRRSSTRSASIARGGAGPVDAAAAARGEGARGRVGAHAGARGADLACKPEPERITRRCAQDWKLVHYPARSRRIPTTCATIRASS